MIETFPPATIVVVLRLMSQPDVPTLQSRQKTPSEVVILAHVAVPAAVAVTPVDPLVSIANDPPETEQLGLVPLTVPKGYVTNAVGGMPPVDGLVPP